MSLKTEPRIRLFSSGVALMVFSFSVCGCLSRSLPGKEEALYSPPALPEVFVISGETSPSLCFWEDFGDEQLNSLVSEALAHNFDLKTAWDRLEQARASARKTGAELKPSLSASFDTYRSKAYTDNAASGDHTTYNNDFSLGLAAGYELDLWGKLSSSLKAADFDFYGKEQDLRTAAITLAAEVADTWYDLVNNRIHIKLVREQIRTDKQYLDSLRLRKKLRSGTQIEDTLRQEQEIESKRAGLIQLVQEGEVLRNSLAVLLGKAPGFLPDLSAEDPVELRPIPDTGVPAGLIRRRPDVLSAEFSLAAAHQRLESAVADRFPEISISGIVNTESVRIDDLFSDWLARIAADVLQPILDGGSREAEIRRNRALVKEAFHSYSQVILDAVSEVETALINESRQVEFIGKIKRQLDIARRIEEQVNLRYYNGAADYLLVLEARGNVQDLERSYVSARAQRIKFRIALYRALSGGWDIERDNARADSREKAVHEYLRRYVK